MEETAAVDNDITSCSDHVDDQVESVRKLSLAELQKRLIVHFDIACQQGEVKWPTKKGRW